MNQKNKGFTLIELMLSMAFISVMLIAITLCVIQISHIYDRGLTIKEVNQAGRSVAADLQESINTTAPFGIAASDGHLVIQNEDGVRLCTGTDSYIINFAKSLATNQNPVNVYDTTNGPVDRPPIHMVKVEDSSAAYCRVDNDSNAYPPVDSTKAVELLDTGDRELAIHTFDIISPLEFGVSDSRIKQRLYTVTFTLGTNDQDALTDELRCKPPADEASNLTYCSINQFSVTARAGNALK